MASLSRQWPSTVGSQNLATGTHTNDSSRVETIVQTPKRTRKTRIIRWILDWTKIRRYCSRMEILTTHMPT
jgi:hypothetical protein